MWTLRVGRSFLTWFTLLVEDATRPAFDAALETATCHNALRGSGPVKSPCPRPPGAEAHARSSHPSSVSLAQRAWNIRAKALLMGEVVGQGYVGQSLGGRLCRRAAGHVERDRYPGQHAGVTRPLIMLVHFDRGSGRPGCDLACVAAYEVRRAGYDSHIGAQRTNDRAMVGGDADADGSGENLDGNLCVS
jgi:hypothetical protein